MSESAYTKEIALQLHNELCGSPFSQYHESNWYVCGSGQHTYHIDPYTQKFWCREAMEGYKPK